MPAKTIDCRVTRALRDPEKFLDHGEYCENEIWDRAEEENGRVGGIMIWPQKIGFELTTRPRVVLLRGERKVDTTQPFC